jgi:16S rRNA processing protein RimM
LASLSPEPGTSPSVPPADLVELGVLSGAYGVKGWLRVRPHSAQASVLTACRRWWLLGLGEPARPVQVTGVRRHSAIVVAKLQGCETPEQADQLRGVRVGVSRDEFPPPADGEVYWIDLIGARVVNRSGVELGTVSDVLSSGAQELLEVRHGEKVLLVPMVERHVDEVNLAQRLVRVDWEADW